MSRPVKFDFDDSFEPEPNSGCWLWTGTLNHGGYGKLWIRDGGRPTGWRSTSAHRYSYERFIGPIPDGLELDHQCRVRCCVNPNHLEPVTHAENVRRGISGEVNGGRMRARTHCIVGHEFAPPNLKIDKYGRRICLECRRRRDRERRNGN
jgi:hypothetical protein